MTENPKVFNQLATTVLKKQLDGYTLMTMKYLNTRHFVVGCPASKLPVAVQDLLCDLIDGYFIVGIPEMHYLDEAENVILTARSAILRDEPLEKEHSYRFYEIIPHKGDQRRRPVLDNVEICDSKLSYMERMKATLQHLLIAQKSDQENPLDDFLANWLKTGITVLARNSDEFQVLNNVATRTQHPEPYNQFSVSEIFKVNGGKALIGTNHRYLFHHTFVSNVAAILREGLLLAPDHIHSVFREFGKGIYFLNAVAKAGLQYKPREPVYILVCRVALGKVKTIKPPYCHSRDELVHLDNMDSGFCAESSGTVRNEDADLNGAKIYCGQIGEFINNDWSNYDRYVIPNESQTKIDYIMKLEFDPPKSEEEKAEPEVPSKKARHN